MWMLMEGVVLYVALVRVFIKKQRYYIAGFTIFSYGMLRRILMLFACSYNHQQLGGYRCGAEVWC